MPEGRGLRHVQYIFVRQGKKSAQRTIERLDFLGRLETNHGEPGILDKDIWVVFCQRGGVIR